MSTQALNPSTLPVNDNVNPYAFCVDVNGQYFVQKGKMIAYYGNIKFEALSVGSLDTLVASSFSSPLYHHDWIVASGNGKLVLGDRGFDINSFDLDAGNLSVRASSLLGFDATLNLKESIVPGYLTLLGTGQFLASSNGPVHFMEPPVRVDPDAIVGWADCPSPCHHYDHGHMRSIMGGLRSMVMGGSGEEHQLDFTGAGMVLVQSSERDPFEAMAGAAGVPVGAAGVGGLAGAALRGNLR